MSFLEIYKKVLYEKPCKKNLYIKVFHGSLLPALMVPESIIQPFNEKKPLTVLPSYCAYEPQP